MNTQRTAPFLLRILFKSVTYGGITYAIAKVLSLVTKIIVARVGIQDFGLYYFTTETTRMLAAFAAFGIPMSVGRFLGFHQSDKTQKTAIVSLAFIIIICLSILVSLLVLAISPLIIRGTEYPDALDIFRIALLNIIGGALLLFAKGVAFGEINPKRAYQYETGDIVCKFIFVLLGLYFIAPTAKGAVIGYTAAALLWGIMVSLHASHPLHFTYIGTLRARIVSFAWPVGLSEILTAITGTAMLTFLSRSMGLEAVSAYGIGVSVATLLFFIPQASLPVLLPLLSNRYARGTLTQRDISQVYRFIWLPTLALAITLLVMSPGLIPYVFQAQPDFNLMPTMILLVAYAWYACIVWISRQVIDMTGRTKINLLITCIRVVFVVNIGIYGILKAGPTGLAIAVLLGWIAEGMVSFFVSRSVVTKISAAQSGILKQPN